MIKIVIYAITDRETATKTIRLLWLHTSALDLSTRIHMQKESKIREVQNASVMT